MEGRGGIRSVFRLRSHTAEQLAQKHRGDPVLATGRLRTETWEQDGANPSRLVLIAESVHFILPASKPNGAGPN